MLSKLGVIPADIPHYPLPDGSGTVIVITQPNYPFPEQQPIPNLPMPNLPPILYPANPYSTTPSGTINQIPMAENNTTQCSCLAGQPYIENGVCKCSQPDAPVTVIDTKNGQPVIYYTNTPTTANNQTSLLDTLKQTLQNNPTLTLAGLGLVAYLVFKKK